MKIQFVINNAQEKIFRSDLQLVSNLEQLEQIHRASCEEVHISDVLDFVLQRQTLLHALIKKLKYSGSLFVSGLDISEICRHVFIGGLPINEIQNLIYNSRVSADNLNSMVQQLKNSQLSIKNKKYDGLKYYIEAARSPVTTV